jgi:hypothetical protein
MEAIIFDPNYFDSHSIEVQVNPEFGGAAGANICQGGRSAADCFKKKP